MAKLFGTDGVRGVAYTELSTELATKLGVAAAKYLANNKGKILIGRDTRGSGQNLEDAVVKGITSSGTDAISCGVIPTPAIAYLIREQGANGGIVISASHNPPQYNGIKFFDLKGAKLSDSTEAEIEDFVSGYKSVDDLVATGKVTRLADATDKYIAHTVSTTDTSLKGLRLAIDCGHGASYQATPEAFRALSAQVHVINDTYSGDDINVDCGSTNLDAITRLVVDTGSDFGIAHDGDADRILAVDEKGTEIDGDFILAICAKQLKDKGKLTNNTVVTTVMANMGLDKAMEKMEIQLLKTDVGDRYVLEKMYSTGATFGGEQSGHIVFLDHNSTGDGLVTAIQLATALKESSTTMSKLTSIMSKYPQVLENVRVSRKSGLATSRAIAEVIAREEATLGKNGRILVRPSGTEPLVRVMAEASTEEAAQTAVANITRVVKKELG